MLKSIIVDTYKNTQSLGAVKFAIADYLEYEVSDEHFYDVLFGQLNALETREAFRYAYPLTFEDVCERMIIALIQSH